MMRIYGHCETLLLIFDKSSPTSSLQPSLPLWCGLSQNTCRRDQGRAERVLVAMEDLIRVRVRNIKKECEEGQSVMAKEDNMKESQWYINGRTLNSAWIQSRAVSPWAQGGGHFG